MQSESVLLSVRDSAMTESVLAESDSTIRNSFSPNWWGKAAMQVALDPKVSDKAYRLFTIIAAFSEGNFANVGQRKLARLMGKSQSYISKRVKELRKSGWLGTKASRNGERTAYILLSPAYGPRRPVGGEPGGNASSGEGA